MPMKAVMNDGRVPVKLWADIGLVEDSALAQLKNLAALQFVFKHVAVMPDVHWGMGATVGSVIATKGAVCPAAVGVDIGCGMAAYQVTNLRIDDLTKLADLRHSIERSVPVGHNGNKTVSPEADSWSGWSDWDSLHEKSRKLFDRARSQLGSLGGGNHFIEVCHDEQGGVWVMLHSGSRNIGKSLAEFYIDDAKSMMSDLFVPLPDPDLAYFSLNRPEGKAYIHDLSWAQAYAAQNREVMMRRVLKDIRHHVGKDLEIGLRVNCHHNFAVMESHFGENVLVTRKGAVRAREDDFGIIPGSMGTRSYIVKGRGNQESFNSCSHGAGRRMSRSAARKAFTTADLEAQTAGVECRKDSDVVDEIPGAYKPIERVMDDQSDLVQVLYILKQVLCVKG